MVDDVLRIEGRQNVVFVLLDYARGEPVAEFFSYPLLAQGLEGFCLGSGQGGEVVVFLYAGKGADADAFAVDALGVFKSRRLHLDKVGHEVLRAGGCARVI